MDRVEIIEGLPRDPAWRVLGPVERKEWAVKLIHRMLSKYLDLGKEPDAWESAELAYAITCVSSGYYTAAISSVNLALAPVEERTPHFVGRNPILLRDALYSALVHANTAPMRDGAY
ncbi:MAG: hypothetical protein V4858_27070 [Pseudomonadota bacterium]